MSETVYKDFSSTAAVWRYYWKAEDSQTAKCKLCKAVIKTTGRSTKGLHVHLKSKHKIDTKQDSEGSSNTAIVSSATSASASNSSASASECTTSRKRKITDHFEKVDNSLEKKVSRMVSKDGLPFRIFCSSSDLRDLFKAASYDLPTSPNSIKLMVMNYGTTIKMTVIRDLLRMKENNHKFTLTFDEWTSTRNRRYINLNIHAFSQDKPIFWNLGLVRIYGSMPAEACISILNDKLSEYNLSLDDDIICITTDGAKVMVKVGNLIKPDQQLCYAHGIQLAVLDVIYKPSPEAEALNEEMAAENEAVSVNEGTNEYLQNVEFDSSESDEDGSFDLSFPASEINLAVEYAEVIKKVRKVVKLFKNSPTKNDRLQTYMLTDMGKNVALLLDCKTRWSSLSDMITIFNKVKLCVSKALVDLGFNANPDYLFTEQEYDVLIELEQILTPVKLAVEVLCRRDSNLMTAETTLRFVVCKLKDIDKPLAKKLVTSLRKRIAERRINLTAVIMYLHDPFKYEKDRTEYMHDKTFNLPSKKVIQQVIKTIVDRLQFKKKEVTLISPSADDSEDELPLVNLKSNSPAPSATLSLQDELQLTLTNLKSTGTPQFRSGHNNLDILIRKEMNYFESGGQKGTYLQFVYNTLMTIVPTSVEAERVFSAAGHIVCKVRSRLADETINTLTFLRSYFQNNI